MKTRLCKNCNNYFKTDKKFSSVCEDCKRKYHEEKVKKKLEGCPFC